MPDAIPDPPIDVPVALALARFEAKLDVAIAQHGAQLQDHERRLATNETGLRDLDSQVRGNALNIAEVRAQLRDVSAGRTQLPVWIGVVVAAIAVVASPIVTALVTH